MKTKRRVSGRKAHINTRNIRQNVSMITDVFIDHKRVNVCGTYGKDQVLVIPKAQWAREYVFTTAVQSSNLCAGRAIFIVNRVGILQGSTLFRISLHQHSHILTTCPFHAIAQAHSFISSSHYSRLGKIPIDTNTKRYVLSDPGNYEPEDTQGSSGPNYLRQ